MEIQSKSFILYTYKKAIIFYEINIYRTKEFLSIYCDLNINTAERTFITNVYC